MASFPAFFAYHARHLFAAFLNPFIIGFVFVAGLLLWLIIWNKHRFLRSVCAFFLLGLILCSTDWLPMTLIRKLSGQYPVVMAINPNIHWVVVLGGGVLETVDAPANQLLNPISLQRLVEGVRLYHQLPKAKLVLSGGSLSRGPAASEAVQFAKIASWFSIPRDDIVLETASINTADEAIAIQQFIYEEPFYLVTSAIHMPRSMALFSHQGLHPIAAPANYPYTAVNYWYQHIVPNPYNFVLMNVALHELIGQAWERLTQKPH